MDLLEHTSTATGYSDYLCAVTRQNDRSLLQDGFWKVLYVESVGHVLHVYLRKKLPGSGQDNNGHFMVKTEISLIFVLRVKEFTLLGARNTFAFLCWLCVWNRSQLALPQESYRASNVQDRNLDSLFMKKKDDIHLNHAFIYLTGGYNVVSWLTTLDLYFCSVTPVNSVCISALVAKLSGEIRVFITMGMVPDDGFVFIRIQHKITSYSINIVMSFTTGIEAGILALGACSDRPAGISSNLSFLGHIKILLAAFVNGFILTFNGTNRSNTEFMTLKTMETHEIGLKLSRFTANELVFAEKKEPKWPMQVLSFAVNSEHKVFEVLVSLCTLDAKSLLQSSKARVQMGTNSPNDEIWSQYKHKLNVSMDVDHEMARPDIYIHQNKESLRFTQFASWDLRDYNSVPSILCYSVPKEFEKYTVVGIDLCDLPSEGEVKCPSVISKASEVNCPSDASCCIIFCPLDITFSHGWIVLNHDTSSAIGSNRYNTLMTTKDFIWESFLGVQANTIALVFFTSVSYLEP